MELFLAAAFVFAVLAAGFIHFQANKISRLQVDITRLTTDYMMLAQAVMHDGRGIAWNRLFEELKDSDFSDIRH